MDQDALVAYRKYADEVVRFAAAVAGPSAAEDIATTVMSRLFHGTSWRTIENLRSYLLRAVANEAASQRRSTRRRTARETEHGHRDAGPDAAVRAEVLDAVRRLTARQRAIVYMTYWLGESGEDVASTLGVSVRTVERELTTARRRLEVLLR